MGIMTISLSTDVILDTVHATAALETVTAETEDVRLLFEPLLSRSARGPVMLMVKNAFAEMLLEILPAVKWCNLDNETGMDGPGHEDGESALLLEFEVADDMLPEGSGGVVRRNLENAVGMRVIANHALAGGDTVRSAVYGSLSAGGVEKVRGMLGCMERPFVSCRGL